MSHYRNLGGGKRDSNEPEIMKRFMSYGWHCEQISGNRLWDLLVWPGGARERIAQFHIHGGALRTYLVDVKEPKGGVTEAQEKKWAELHAKGIPVYIARTEADVDAIVAGTAKPWEPERKHPVLTSERVSKALRASAPAVLATVAADAGKRLRVVRQPGTGRRRASRTVSFNEAMDALVPERKRAQPRPAYETPHKHLCGKNGCRKHRPCAGHDGTMKGWAAGMVESAYTPPRPAYEATVPRGSRANPMATKALVPSNAAEFRALLAAQGAEETFAPAPCSTSSPCGHCVGCLGSISG